MLYVLALLIGVVAGLRAMTPPAAIAWGAWLGWLPLSGTWAGFMGHWIAVAIFSVLALVELVADQLPSTPSRKVPVQFGARLVSGAFGGATIGTAGGALIAGLIAGVVGAVIGTLAARKPAPGSPAPSAATCRPPSSRTPSPSCSHRGSSRRSHDARTSTPSSSAPARPAPPLAGRLAAAGLTVALIERKLFGGTCVNTGCMPTKTLVASAYAAHLARRAADYGVFHRRRRRDRHEGREGAQGQGDAGCPRRRRRLARGMERCTVFHGHARFARRTRSA